MRFRHPKLPNSRLDTLRKVKAENFQHHELLPGPAYIHLPRNDRFVAIKSPLAFFTHADLTRYAGHENIYLTEFVDRVIPFEHVGATIKKLLGMREKNLIKASSGKPEEIILPVNPAQLSDSVLQAVAPLWSPAGRIESFFLVFFAHVLLDPLDPALIDELHDQSVEQFEVALLRSSAAVFLALHLGWTEAGLLTRLREQVFKNCGMDSPVLTMITGLEAQELVALVCELIRRPSSSLDLETIQNSKTRVGSKISNRLQRIHANFLSSAAIQASVLGEEGICDE